jgi:ribosomal protein L7/L12
MTNDRARRLLIDAVQNPETMQDLLKNIDEMGIDEQARVFSRLEARIGIPKAATVPAASSAAQAAGQEEQRQQPSLQDRLQQLRGQ